MASLRIELMEALTATYMPMSNEGEGQDISDLAGDASATLQAIWEEFGCEMLWHRCLNWMGGHHEDAEDAMNTAAVRICKYLRGREDTVSNPQAWLSRLLYNQCMTMQRGNQRRQHYIQNVMEVETMAHATSTHRQESTEDTVLQGELASHVHSLIEALPKRLREPLRLYFFQGMSQRDIAHYLNLSHDNVRKRLQQARDILRSQLAQYLRGENAVA